MLKKIPVVAIIGKTNVGKSSLFNAIIRQKRAIVAKEEGTTRDSIIELTEYKQHNFWLVDTAGVKDPVDDFELTIQEQIKDAINYSDIIWFLVETNTVITDDDRKIAKLAFKSQKPTILIINKIDQANKNDQTYFKQLGLKNIIETSTVQKKGINDLLTQTVKLIPQISNVKKNKSIKLSLIGRPNVGKSSLFNAISNKQQAIIADQAGTTRDVNKNEIKFYNEYIELIDTAGIRRSGRIQVGIEKFSVLRSVSAIEQSDVCLLVLDANELNVQLDQKLAGMIKDAGKGLIITITKWDTLIDKTAFSRDQIFSQLKFNFDFVPWAPVIFVSSLTGQNVTKILDLSLEIYNNRQIKIPTSKLNKWLHEATANHPPAGLKNKTPKLNYMIQENEMDLPSFQIFSTQTKYIHWSYKRYLEKSLRKTFGFEGTAIKIWFIEKKPRLEHSYQKKTNYPIIK